MTCLDVSVGKALTKGLPGQLDRRNTSRILQLTAHISPSVHLMSYTDVDNETQNKVKHNPPARHVGMTFTNRVRER